MWLAIGVYAQDTVLSLPTKDDLRVGLVLSGGGAKGLAHIGVLKVLEEEGVRIDYIAGTSMGAIVGGLYAYGYSATQLDSIFRTIDFDELVQDNLPRHVKSYYEKNNSEKFAFTFPIQKAKISLPVALSKGQNVYNLLNELLYEARFTNDFSQLHIPFVCMATDVETGKEVMLNNGNLVDAIMASATLPTLFNPIKIGEQYLIDGGVVNNYPIDKLQDKGLDVIVGVDVQSRLLEHNELFSADKLLRQIINFQMLDAMKHKAEYTDIYLRPDISKFNVISFRDGEKIIKVGEDAADAKRHIFKEIASKQINKPKSRSPKPIDYIRADHIDVIGTANYSRAYVLGKLAFTTNEIQPVKFDEGFKRLNATYNFKNINYHFEKMDNQQEKLVLNLKDNEIKNYFAVGLHYNNLYRSGLLLKYINKKFLVQNDVLKVGIVLGDNFRYTFDYYIDNGFYWSFGVNSSLNQFRVDTPANLTKYTFNGLELPSVNVSLSDLTNKVYFQTMFKDMLYAGVGAEHKLLNFDTKTIIINGQRLDNIYKSSNFLSLYGYTILDTYDKKYFPKKGYYFEGNFKWILKANALGNDTPSYSMVYGNLGLAHTFFNKLSFNIDTQLGFTIGNSDGILDFVFGGYGFKEGFHVKHFYGYDFLSLTGDSYVKSNLGIDYEFYKKNHLNIYFNMANIGENLLESTQKWINKPSYTGYAFGYGLETIIGPIEIKYSWSPEIKQNFWWVNIGFWF
ncbi:MAG: patatin-like phospholipase family protein [Bacteroidota bacterium]|nr:patatin-like phospholipase family protein [Bacteroidota bacterium]